MRLFEVAKQPWDRYAAVGVEVWLEALIAGGLLVLANTLTFNDHGRSLLAIP